MPEQLDREDIVTLWVQQAGLALQVAVHHAGGAVVVAVSGQDLAVLGAGVVHGGAHLGERGKKGTKAQM